MKEYILFLDESKNTPPSEHFALGGCIIEKNTYEQEIIPYVNQIKRDVFGSELIILHETDIRKVKKEEYKLIRNKEKREMFWDRMKNLFEGYDITVLCSVIDPKEYKNLYNSNYLNDVYFITLQILLENFSHFLEKNNGIGSVIIESSNTKADNRLAEKFNILKKHGTLFMSKHALQNKIGTISFLPKSSNSIGLQIADFVPNVMKKHLNKEKQLKPSIADSIYKNVYDGEIQKKNIFGIKKVL